MTIFDNNDHKDLSNSIHMSDSEIQSSDSYRSDNSSVYGVVYAKSNDDSNYVCNSYNIAESQELESDVREQQKKDVKNKKRSGKLVLITCAVIAMLLVISAASALFAALLTKKHYESLYNTPAQQPVGQGKKEPQDHYFFVDDSNPKPSTQIAEPGKLLTMEQAIAKVKDSVVEITTERLQSGFGSFSQYVVSGAGSGVIISNGGYIITNNHVIEGANNIIVRLTNGKEYDAVLVATDAKTDVAVISIIPDDGESLTPAVIGSSETLCLGQTVIAIGNPLGKLGGTVSDGIISCLAREIAIEGSGTMTLLQTNAAVSPGNSGGGLFDLYGRLIGVVNAKSTGEGVEGISFAIPIDTAWDVANQLIDKGYVSGRPSIGVTIKQVQYGYSIFGEYFYQLVVAEAPEDSNLKVNDTIYSIDSIEVASLTDISDILSSKKVGDTVTITVRRDRKLLDVEVTLIEYLPDMSIQN